MRATLLGLIFVVGCGGGTLTPPRDSTTPPPGDTAPSNDAAVPGADTQAPDNTVVPTDSGTVAQPDVPVDVGPIVGKGDPTVSGPYLFSFADAICNTSELCHLQGGQSCMFGVMNTILAPGPVTGIAVTAYNACMALVDVPPIKITPAVCDMFKAANPIPDVCFQAFLH